MGWILMVLIFDVHGGDISARNAMHKVYPSEETCNEAGRAFRGIEKLPVGVKSMSICIDPAWMEQSGWQTEGPNG